MTKLRASITRYFTYILYTSLYSIRMTKIFIIKCVRFGSMCIECVIWSLSSVPLIKLHIEHVRIHNLFPYSSDPQMGACPQVGTATKMGT